MSHSSELSTSIVLFLVFGLVFVAGCASQQQNATPPAQNAAQVPPSANQSAPSAPPQPPPVAQAQNAMTTSVLVSTSAPSIKLYSNATYFLAVDFDGKRYIDYSADRSINSLYLNGTFYRITNLSGKCFIAGHSDDFYNIPDTSQELQLLLFVDVTNNTLQTANLSQAEREQGNALLNGLQPAGDGTFRSGAAWGPLANNTFVPFGGHYLAKDVSFNDSGVIYHYAYSNMTGISSTDMDGLVQKEIGIWKGCEPLLKGMKPLG